MWKESNPDGPIRFLTRFFDYFMLPHQKFLTSLLLLLSGMLLGTLLMLFSGRWTPPERVKVRYTEVMRSTAPYAEDTLIAHSFNPTYLFRDVASHILPGVVYIESSLPHDGILTEDPHHNFEDRFWDRFIPRHRALSIGSGVLISSDGYILTNHHVIDGSSDRIQVMTHDKREYRALLVGSDPSTDLAVIKIDVDNASPLVIGNSDHVQIGDWVMAVGNPFRLRSTVTAGIVSAKGRDVDIINDRMRVESFIQTDAAINRGNSGGALVNTRGELIGINTAIASESGSYQGYGFAVPINLAMKIGRDMIEYGSVRRAFLGVEIASLNYQSALRYGLETVAGVEIRNVAPGGSAYTGGLRKGDVIRSVNRFPVSEANELQERIALLHPGDSVNMEIWRSGQPETVTFALMGMEDEAIRKWVLAEPQGPVESPLELDEQPAVHQTSLPEGFTIAALPVSDDLRNELVVIRVEPYSAAEEAGLTEDDIITQINGQYLRDMDMFTAIWAEKKSNRSAATLTINRNGHFYSLTFDF